MNLNFVLRVAALILLILATIFALALATSVWPQCWVSRSLALHAGSARRWRQSMYREPVRSTPTAVGRVLRVVWVHSRG
jgi:hypothetical protein